MTETTKLVVLGLWAVEVVLPTWGVFRLLAKSHRTVREVRRLAMEEGRAEDLGAWIGEPRERVREAWITAGLVGGGLLCGAVANWLTLD